MGVDNKKKGPSAKKGGDKRTVRTPQANAGAPAQPTPAAAGPAAPKQEPPKPAPGNPVVTPQVREKSRQPAPLTPEQIRERALEAGRKQALFVGDSTTGKIEKNANPKGDNLYVVRQEGGRIIFLETPVRLPEESELVSAKATVEVIQVLGTPGQYKAVITSYEKRLPDGTTTAVPAAGGEVRGAKAKQLTEKERALEGELGQLSDINSRVMPREHVTKLRLNIVDDEGRIGVYAGRLSKAGRPQVKVPTIRRMDLATVRSVEEPVYILGALEDKNTVEGLFEHDVELLGAVDYYQQVMIQHEIVLRHIDPVASLVSTPRLQASDELRATIKEQRRIALDAYGALGTVADDANFGREVKALYAAVKALDTALSEVEALNTEKVAAFRENSTVHAKQQDILLFEFHRYRQEVQANYEGLKGSRLELLEERERLLQQNPTPAAKAKKAELETAVVALENQLRESDPSARFLRVMSLSRIAATYLERYPELRDLGMAGGLEFMKFQEELIQSREGKVITGDEIELWPTSILRHRDYEKTVLNDEYFASREQVLETPADREKMAILYFAYTKKSGKWTRQEYSIRPTEALQHFRVVGDLVYFTQSFIESDGDKGLTLGMSAERRMNKVDFLALFGEKALVIDSRQTTAVLFEQAVRGGNMTDIIQYVRGFSSLGPEGGFLYASFVDNENEFAVHIRDIIHSRLAQYIGIPVSALTISAYQSTKETDPLRVDIKYGEPTHGFVFTGNPAKDTVEFKRLESFKLVVDAVMNDVDEVDGTGPKKVKDPFTLNYDQQSDTASAPLPPLDAQGTVEREQSKEGIPKNSPLERLLQTMGLPADFAVDEALAKGTITLALTGLVSYSGGSGRPDIYPVAFEIRGLKWDDEKPDDEAQVHMTERYASPAGGMAPGGKNVIRPISLFKKFGPFRLVESVSTPPKPPEAPKPPAAEKAPRERGVEIIGDDKEQMMEVQRIETLFENGAVVIGGSDKGIGYDDHNEDRVVIDGMRNEATVIDGMGGHDGGEIAASIIAEVMAGPGAVEERLLRCKEKLAEAVVKGQIDASAGAAMSHLRMNPDGSADVWWAADTRVMIVGADGAVKFVSKDQSFVQEEVDKGRISADIALVHDSRNIVVSPMYVNIDINGIAHERITGLQPGDRILLMSDGVSDNLTPEECVQIIKGTKTPQEAYDVLVRAVTQRMDWNADPAQEATIQKESFERKTGKRAVYSDGFRSRPKNDNRSLIIIEVPGAKKPAATKPVPTPAPSAPKSNPPANPTPSEPKPAPPAPPKPPVATMPPGSVPPQRPPRGPMSQRPESAQAPELPKASEPQPPQRSTSGTRNPGALNFGDFAAPSGAPAPSPTAVRPDSGTAGPISTPAAEATPKTTVIEFDPAAKVVIDNVSAKLRDFFQKDSSSYADILNAIANDPQFRSFSPRRVENKTMISMTLPDGTIIAFPVGVYTTYTDVFDRGGTKIEEPGYFTVENSGDNRKGLPEIDRILSPAIISSSGVCIQKGRLLIKKTN